MLRAVVAGLLSMLAVVPPALAQEERPRGDRERGSGGRPERAADRGDWRRERPVAAPSAPTWGGAAATPRPDAPDRRGDARPVEGARPQEGRPPRFGDDGRGNGGRGNGGRGADGRGWDGRGWNGARPSLPDRPDDGSGWRGARPAISDRDSDGRDGRGARPSTPDRVEPARRGEWGVRRPPGEWRGGGEWRSDRDRGAYERPARGGGAWRSERFDSPGYDARRGGGRAYRLPRYYAPSGWNRGYRRFDVGVRIAPVLFARSYWIDDPWAYQLPDADDRYRWVRYYGDALLVDLDSGQVVDVIHDIFG